MFFINVNLGAVKLIRASLDKNSCSKIIEKVFMLNNSFRSDRIYI